MSREIKFRAWDTAYKKFLGPKEGVFIRGDGVVIELEFQGYYEPSDRYKIQQYTGLKDKNGKEIYEGDIVILGSSEKDYKQTGELGNIVPGVVEWGEGEYDYGEYGRFTWTGWCLSGLWGCDNDLHHRGVVVIGNIYESPGLLAGDDK